MKKILFLLIFTASINLFSQDVIILNSGKQIEAVIREVNDSTIIYHKYSNQDGPVYKTDIHNVMEVNYSNGEKITYDAGNEYYHYNYQQQDLTKHGFGLRYKGKKLSNKEIRNLYTDYPKSLQNFNASKVLLGVGLASSFFSFGYYIYVSINNIKGKDNPPGYYFIGLSTAGIGITCLIMSPFRLQKSVRIYNMSTENANQSSLLNFQFGVTSNGIGILCSF